MPKIYEDVKAALISGLDCLIAGNVEPYLDELHSELYNSDYHYIYYADAKEATPFTLMKSGTIN